MRDSFVAAFDRLVERRPGGPLALSPGCPPLTVADLDALSRSVAERCGSAGVAPGTVVALAASGIPFLASVLAVRRLGCVALLLEAGGPRSYTVRTATALGAATLLSSKAGAEASPEAIEIEPIVPDSSASSLPCSAAFIKTTSGSTGSPRGVAVTADAMLADEEALAATMGISEHDRIVAAVPLSHSYGFASAALPALVRGCALVLPEGGGPLSPLLAARATQATVFPTAPAYLAALLRMSRPPDWPDSCRLIISAGARLDPETAARFRERCGRAVHVFYGASECGGICYDREGGAAERGTVGAPVNGVEIAIDPVPDAPHEGVVTVTSAAVGATYVPEPDPERLAEGRFRTSDIGRLVRGELMLLRRADAVINVKGRKVDPAEIEAVVAALTGVEEVVALGVADPSTGNQSVRVVIACRPGAVSCEDVLHFCRSRLAEHKVPRSVKLVPEIPRTARGKIDRSQLAEGR